MSRATYQNPPVHEVVIAARLLQELDTGSLQKIQKVVRSSFDFPEINPLTSAQLIMSRPDSVEELAPWFQQTTRQSFEGWLFRDEEPGQVLRIQRDLVSYHHVRPGKWPKGPYPGWNTIISQYQQLYQALMPYLEDIPLRRIGLRYLNRIAIPEGEDPGEWLRLRLEAPGFLRRVHGYDIRQTWEDVDDNNDVSATISLRQIPIEDKDIAENCQGILLDIDVFTLRRAEAPHYNDILEWLERAHLAENRIFESCVTDRLRNNFGGTDG